MYDETKWQQAVERLKAHNEQLTSTIAKMRSNTEETVLALKEFSKAMEYTRQYVGYETLPAIPGWSWFDADEAAKGLIERISNGDVQESYVNQSADIDDLVAWKDDALAKIEQLKNQITKMNEGLVHASIQIRRCNYTQARYSILEMINDIEQYNRQADCA